MLAARRHGRRRGVVVVTLCQAKWAARYVSEVGEYSRQDRVEVARADEDEVLHLVWCLDVLLRWRVTC